MKPLADQQIPLIPDPSVLPLALEFFPRFRYMGSKFRLLPWIHDTLWGLDFGTATDVFSG